MKNTHFFSLAFCKPAEEIRLLTTWFRYLHRIVKQLKAFKNSNLTSIRNRNNVEPKILKKIPLCFKNMGTLKYYMKFLFSNSLIQKMTKLPLWRLKHLSSWVELEFQPRKSLFGWENIMRNFLLDSLLPYWSPLKP